MTGFEEGTNREVWSRGKLIVVWVGGVGRWTDITPGHILFFFFFSLCFVAPLPVIAAVLLAVGKSAEE